MNNQLTCNRQSFCVNKFATVVPISLTRNHKRQVLSLVLTSQAKPAFSCHCYYNQYQYYKELIARQESIAFDWSKQGPVRLFCKHTTPPKFSVLQFWDLTSKFLHFVQTSFLHTLIFTLAGVRKT